MAEQQISAAAEFQKTCKAPCTMHAWEVQAPLKYEDLQRVIAERVALNLHRPFAKADACWCPGGLYRSNALKKTPSATIL